MQTIEKSPTHLVIGGWKPGNIVAALALLAAPVVIYVQTGWQAPWMMWATLFLAAVTIALALRLTLWERIAFDADAGEAHFDQLTATGRHRRAVALKPVSRVELDITARISRAGGGRAPRRLTLVTGHERTPFTSSYSGSARLDAERDELNAWLETAFGDRWRDAPTRLREAAPSDEADAAPQEGMIRIRHPATGLAIDVPEDWSATVRFDRRGPLRLFGVTLLKHFDRAGPERQPGDGDDWNTLIIKGAEDAGLKLATHDGPLLRKPDDTLDDPWSMQWGMEVLETTDPVQLGGMTGFSIARRIPEGGSTPDFGKVAAEVTTRQRWLGADAVHIEIVTLARRDDGEMQRALDAMVASTQLPAADRPDARRRNEAPGAIAGQ